jgi:hypothetical protein
MSEQINLGNCRKTGKRVQQVLQGITRIVRTFPVVGVGTQPRFAARRPCKQDRNCRGFLVMHNLGKSIYRVVEAVVEPVNEDKHFASAGLFCDSGDGGHKALFIGIVR